jgi:hypothetical protein
MAQHNWVRSTLGHGDVMCSKCYITNREAVVLGLPNICDVPDATTEQPRALSERKKDEGDE